VAVLASHEPQRWDLTQRLRGQRLIVLIGLERFAAPAPDSSTATLSVYTERGRATQRERQRGREREKERERQRERLRERERETERGAEREAERQRGREAERQRGRDT
jgi:hypothetical protein